jgi:uncharacterized protein YdhG (YjbR/CyaY superfamily)
MITTIDEYIAQFPPDIQEILQKIRKLIHEIAPEVTEAISYQMPAFSLNRKPLAYFAVFKKHIGFYPTPTGIDAFKDELSAYKQGKGSVQFPLNKPIPFELITKIVQFRKEKLIDLYGKDTVRKNFE